jgi:hypothetical protein
MKATAAYKKLYLYIISNYSGKYLSIILLGYFAVCPETHSQAEIR